MSSISFSETINYLNEQHRVSSFAAPKSVAILGGGPAGLMHAIISVLKGAKTTLIELRDEHASGRPNTVQIQEETIKLLKEYGIYQWLEENGKIFPPGPFKTISVRLTDLETAMKAVLQEISKEHPLEVYYKSKVESIQVKDTANKVDLLLSSGTVIPSLDIIVNAEGAKSSTNELLNNSRVVVLPSLPVIAAIFTDERPEIVDITTFFTSLGLTIAYTAMAIYHYAIFFFHLIFLGEFFTNPEREIAGSLILATPSQNYVGAGLSPKKSDELLTLQKDITEKKDAFEAAKDSGVDTKVLEEELKRSIDRYSTFLEYWTHLSFCAANFFSFADKVVSFFCGKSAEIHYDTAPWLPFKDASIAEIGADRARDASLLLKQTLVLITGDALATPDPTTGLGCNTALRSALLFDKVCTNYDREDLNRISQKYSEEANTTTDKIHRESRRKRLIYRPDATIK